MRSMIQRALLIVLLAVTAVWVPRLCNAQEYRATITGTVEDSSKAVIPKAKVTVRNLDTNNSTTVETSATGDYSVEYLHPGQRFEVVVEAPGFKKTVHPAVVLSISQILTMNFTLQVGNATGEVITVTASEAQIALDSESAQRGTVIDNKTITEMPIDGRNPLALLDDVAGVTNENGPGSQGTATDMYNASNYTINGGGAQQVEYSIDGQPDNSIPWYSVGPSAIPSVDAIQEFKVITNPYDAQFGHTTGGVISMELKSGTNAVHGSAYEFAKRGYMDANTWLNKYNGVNRAAHTEDQFGAELEGPVVVPHLYNGRDKTFFMINAELFRQKYPAQAYAFDVPDPAWINGDFSNYTDGNGNLYPIYDPATATTANPTRTPFMTNGQYNVIPANRINPVAQNVLKMMVSATQEKATHLQGAQPWESTWVDTEPWGGFFHNWIAKVDQNIGSRDRLSVSYIHDTNLATQPWTPQGVPWENGEHFREYHLNSGIDWVHTQRSNLLFEARVSYQRYWRTDGFPNSGFDPTTLGLPGSTISGIPDPPGFPMFNWTVTAPKVAGQGYMGTSRDYYYMPDQTFSIAPTVTWNKTKHSIRGGIDLRSTYVSQIANYNNLFQSTDSGLATSQLYNHNGKNDGNPLPGNVATGKFSGNGFADFLLGQLSSVSVTNQDFPTYNYHYIAPWVQDDWKITSKLTLNLGFRYDLNGPPTTRHNWFTYGFDMNVTSPINGEVNHTQYPNLPAVIQGGYTFPTSWGKALPWNRDYSKYQPRVGFAYSLRPTTVIRGGVGRMANNSLDEPDSGVGFSNPPVFQNTSDGGRTDFNSGGLLLGAGELANPFPNGIPAIPGAAVGAMGNLGEGASIHNPNYKIPFIYQYSLGAQQTFGNYGKLEVSYVGNQVYDMDTTSVQLNTNETMLQGCNDLLGTLTNPSPEGYCEQLVGNPFVGIPGVLGGLGRNAQVSRLSMASPRPAFGNITENMLNQGRSWYNSLQTTFQLRKDWAQLNGSWTWSNNMTSGGYVDQNYAIPMRTIASNDRKHRLTLTGVQNIPIGRGKKYFSQTSRPVDMVLGGWELAESFFYETGQPFPLTNWGNNYTMAHSQSGSTLTPPTKADWHGAKVPAQPDTLDFHVNQCVFDYQYSDGTTPGAYYFADNGNGQTANNCPVGGPGWYQPVTYGPTPAQPNEGNIRTAGTSQLDANLAKTFKILGRMSLQTRLEVTNVLNHPTYAQNWNVGSGYASDTPDSQFFGMLNKPNNGQSNNPRYVQLAVKLLW